MQESRTKKQDIYKNQILLGSCFLALVSNTYTASTFTTIFPLTAFEYGQAR
jgi:hypothetical protein